MATVPEPRSNFTKVSATKPREGNWRDIQRAAASTAATAKSEARRRRRFTNSAPCGRGSVTGGRGRVASWLGLHTWGISEIQVAGEQNLRGQLIDGAGSLGDADAAGLEHALGFDGGQALIPIANGEAGARGQPLSEVASVVGLPAFAAA